jgi:hypothetical protein
MPLRVRSLIRSLGWVVSKKTRNKATIVRIRDAVRYANLILSTVTSKIQMLKITFEPSGWNKACIINRKLATGNSNLNVALKNSRVIFPKKVNGIMTNTKMMVGSQKERLRKDKMTSVKIKVSFVIGFSSCRKLFRSI